VDAFHVFPFDWAQGPKDTLNALAEGDYPNLAGKFLTPGTLPFATLRVAGRTKASAPIQTIQSRLFLEVDVLDIFDGEAEESLSESAELFGGIGGEEFQAGRGTALFRGI
jgi:hypothetical protein